MSTPNIAEAGPVPGPAPIATRRRWTQEETDAFMASQPRATVIIQMSDQELSEAKGKPVYHPVMWNGYLYNVQKGVMVEVPKPIAEIVWQSQQPLRTEQAQTASPYMIPVIGGGLGNEIVR